MNHSQEEIDNVAEEYVNSIDSNIISYDIQETVIRSVYSDQTMNIVNGKLRDVKPLKLFYEEVDTIKYKDCVRDYLKKNYKKISAKTIDKLGNRDGVSTKEIYEFCKKYNILMIAYDVIGNVISKSTHTCSPRPSLGLSTLTRTALPEPETFTSTFFSIFSASSLLAALT